MKPAPGENPETGSARDDDSTGERYTSTDDPRVDERQRATRRFDPRLDRIHRHLLPADDDLPLAEGIRHHRELQEHAAACRREVGDA